MSGHHGLRPRITCHHRDKRCEYQQKQTDSPDHSFSFEWTCNRGRPVRWEGRAGQPFCGRSVSLAGADGEKNFSYTRFCFFNSFTISLTTPSITFCADFGLNESLVPVQMSSPSPGVAAYRFVSTRTVVSSRK